VISTFFLIFPVEIWRVWGNISKKTLFVYNLKPLFFLGHQVAKFCPNFFFNFFKTYANFTTCIIGLYEWWIIDVFTENVSFHVYSLLRESVGGTPQDEGITGGRAQVRWWPTTGPIPVISKGQLPHQKDAEKS
jgi:hypothetical protein